MENSKCWMIFGLRLKNIFSYQCVLQSVELPPVNYHTASYPCQLSYRQLPVPKAHQDSYSCYKLLVTRDLAIGEEVVCFRVHIWAFTIIPVPHTY
jgi:hypothetical protein